MLNSSKEWYTPKELAAKLDVNYITILRALQSGEIKAARVGALWRIYQTEYERIIREAT